MSSLNPNSMIAREILNDETLLWQGRPGQGLRFQAGDLLMVPFSLMWAGFAFFWEYMVLRESGFNITRPFDTSHLTFFPLWGLMFCAVGLYIVAGRFFYDAISRSRTWYAVTDHRILLVKGRRVTALPIRSLPAIDLSPGSNGRGTITFGSRNWFDMAGMWGYRNRPASPAFIAITDARRVYLIIQEAIRVLNETRA